MITDALTDPSTLARTGDKTVFFSGRAANGRIIDKDFFAGKVVFLCFFTTWCPGCRKEMPVLQDMIWNKHRDKNDFAMLVIAREEEEHTVNSFADEHGYTMTFLADTDRSIYGMFADKYVPRNIVAGKDGTILFQSRGFSNEEISEIDRIITENLEK
jgi:peroxiredoxin